MRVRELNLDRLAPGLYAALAGALLAPLLACFTCLPFPAGSPYSDLLITHLPNAEYWRTAVFQFGQWPLWNAQLFAGQPFAADPLAGVWYPPNWLLLVLPLPYGFSLLLTAHLAGTGWGLYRWLRREGLPAGPALFGGLAWLAAPKLLAHLGAGHFSLVCAVAWTPWLLQALRPLRAAGGFRPGALAGGVLALILLADPRWAFFAAGLAALYWLAALPPFARARLAAGRGLAGALGLALFFLALSAVLLVPLYVLVLRSNRAELTLAEGALYSLPPYYLLGLLIPDLRGFHEWMTYLGVAPLLLAPAGLLARRQWFWGLLALGAGLFALGANGPVFPALFRVLPGLGYLRVPPRAWFLVVLAAVILAAHGLDWLSTEAWPRLLASPALPRLRRWLPAAASLALGVGAFTALDLARVDWTLFEARPRPASVPAAEWIKAQAAPGEHFRVYSPSYSLPLDDGLEHVDGVNPLQLADAARFIADAAGVPLAGYSVALPRLDGPDPATANLTATLDAAQLGLLNVKYVAAEFAVQAPGLDLVQTFGRTRLYLNRRQQPRAWMDTGAPASITAWSPNRVAVTAAGPGQLVLSEVAYPGWLVWVDGAPATPEAAHAILRAVTLDAGQHQVVFEFQPPSVYQGLGLTVIGLAALAGLAAWDARRGRRR